MIRSITPRPRRKLAASDYVLRKVESGMDLSCKVGGLIHSRHDKSRDTLECLACDGFQPSNAPDEPHINPCRDIGGKDDVNKLVEPQTGNNVSSRLIVVTC